VKGYRVAKNVREAETAMRGGRRDEKSGRRKGRGAAEELRVSLEWVVQIQELGAELVKKLAHLPFRNFLGKWVL
jgi:hypothetical protein